MSKEPSLSNQELKILAAAWMSCNTPPKPNYQRVAEICNYKNAATAATSFSNVRKKLFANSDDVAGAHASKKRSAATSNEDGSATKKKRGRKAKETTTSTQSKNKAVDDEDERDNDTKVEIKEEHDPGFFTSATEYLDHTDNDE